MNAAARRAGVVVVALVLVWRVLHVNVNSYDDDGRPALPSLPDTLASAASADRALLKRLLDDNPANIEALLVLAREHERSGEQREARAAYHAAFQLAPLDRAVLGSGAEHFLRQGADAESFALLDRLVDNYPEARTRAFPILAAMLVQGRERAGWAQLTAQKRAWLGPFIVSACQAGVDPTHLMPLLLARTSDGRAGAAETACVVDRLRDTDRWEEAYHVWLNTLARERLAEVGFVFNGSFEYAPSGFGFDWRPSRAREREVGYTVEMPQAAGVSGKRALRVSYSGKRQSGVPIAQYLALAPGRYQLSGSARPQSITAGRGVRWTLRCVKAGAAAAPIAESERFVGSSEWRRFTVEVTIPAGCAGQVLQLEPVGAEEGAVYLAGTAWFDELVLHRRG